MVYGINTLQQNICKPIEVKKARDWCVNHGLTPKD